MVEREEIYVRVQGRKAGAMIRRRFDTDGIDLTSRDDARLFTCFKYTGVSGARHFRNIYNTIEQCGMSVTVRMRSRVVTCCYRKHVFKCSASELGQAVYFHRTSIRNKNKLRTTQH